MSSGWAFYNAVRAWVAQHPIPPPDKPVEGPVDVLRNAEATGPSTPDAS